jgi:hypothetical protein
MTGITLNMQALFVQKHSLAFLLVDQPVAVVKMLVLNLLNITLVRYSGIFFSLLILCFCHAGHGYSRCKAWCFEISSKHSAISRKAAP